MRLYLDWTFHCEDKWHTERTTLLVSSSPFIFRQKRSLSPLQASVFLSFFVLAKICWWVRERLPLRENTSMIILSLEVWGGELFWGENIKEKNWYHAVTTHFLRSRVYTAVHHPYWPKSLIVLAFLWCWKFLWTTTGCPKKMSHSDFLLESVPEVRLYFFTCVSELHL